MWCHHRKLTWIAKAIKVANYALHRALLPAEANVGRDVVLEHYALGIVLHPNVTLGDGVRIYHHVTIAAEMNLDSVNRVVVGDRVTVGAHAIIVSPPHAGLSIGDDAVIGAGSVVTGDVPARAVVVGNPAAIVRYRSDAEIADPYAASLAKARRRQVPDQTAGNPTTGNPTTGNPTAGNQITGNPTTVPANETGGNGANRTCAD